MNATECVHLMTNAKVMNTSNGNSFAFYTKTQPCGDNQKGVILIVFLRLQVKHQLDIRHFMLPFMRLFVLIPQSSVNATNYFTYFSMQTWIPDWRTGGVQKVSLKCSKYLQLWRALWPNHRLSILWILWKSEDLHHRSYSCSWSYWQWLQEASKMCQVRSWRFNLSW